MESLEIWDILLRMGLAVLAGGVVGYEREHKSRPAGLRTHILVCLGAAVVALIECMNTVYTIQLNGQNPDSGITVAMGRMCAQVVSGIGFLGAGTIITTKRNILGLTTAASLWNVACLGIAAGMGYYGIALIGAGGTLVVLTVIKRLVIVHVAKQMEVSFVHRLETLDFLNDYYEKHRIKVHDVDFTMEQRGDVNVYTNVYTLELPHKLEYVTVVNDIAEHPNVQKVRTRDI